MNFRSQSVASALAVRCFAGGALVLSSAGLAHDVHDHAAHMAMAAKPGYERSLSAYSIPDVVLTDANSRPVRLRELLATQDPVMMNFIFTTCGAICPVMSKVFSEVPAGLGAQAGRLRMISISIDPENDTPEKLKAYAKSYGATARWTFLTGKVEDIKSVQLAFGTYRGDKMNHQPLTLLRMSPDKSWVRIDGFASSDELAREYRALPQP